MPASGSARLDLAGARPAREQRGRVVELCQVLGRCQWGLCCARRQQAGAHGPAAACPPAPHTNQATLKEGPRLGRRLGLRAARGLVSAAARDEQVAALQRGS